MPPSASSISHGLFCASMPNSSASRSGSLIALQLNRANGAPQRGDISWTRSANRSLPTPCSARRSARRACPPPRSAPPTARRRGQLARLRRRLAARARPGLHHRRHCAHQVPHADGAGRASPTAAARRRRTCRSSCPRPRGTRPRRPAGGSRGAARPSQVPITTSQPLARLVVSVPVPGGGITCSDAPSIHEEDALAERRLALDLLGRRALVIVELAPRGTPGTPRGRQSTGLGPRRPHVGAVCDGDAAPARVGRCRLGGPRRLRSGPVRSPRRHGASRPQARFGSVRRCSWSCCAFSTACEVMFTISSTVESFCIAATEPGRPEQDRAHRRRPADRLRHLIRRVPRRQRAEHQRVRRPRQPREPVHRPPACPDRARSPAASRRRSPAPGVARAPARSSAGCA